MHLVIRLLPTDEWREFSFSSTSILLEVKIRALQQLGILLPILAAPSAPPALFPSALISSGRPRTAGAPERTRDSSIKAHRRSSLLGPGDHGSNTSTLTQLGASEDLLKAAETLARYCLMSVCAGYFLDDNKTLGVACVNYDLLVLQQRRKALILPLEGFCSPYLRVSCLVQTTAHGIPSTSILGLDDDSHDSKLFKPYTLTLLDSQLWLFETPNDTTPACYQLLDLPCTVSPASFATGAGSRNLLKMTMGDGTRLRIRTAREEDWERLLMCFGPEGTTIPSFDRRAHLQWREGVFRRAQRSNQGLLPPYTATYTATEEYIPTSTPTPTTPETKRTASSQFADVNVSPNSAQKLKYQSSKEAGLGGTSVDMQTERLAMKRSKTDLPGLQPSADIELQQVPRRARSFSTPPSQVPNIEQPPVFVSGSIPMPKFEQLPSTPNGNPNLQLADIASSPEAGSSMMSFRRQRQGSEPSHSESVESWVDSGYGYPRTQAEAYAFKERSRETDQVHETHMPRLMARDTRAPVRERKFRRWNDPDSDEFSD